MEFELIWSFDKPWEISRLLKCINSNLSCEIFSNSSSGSLIRSLQKLFAAIAAPPLLKENEITKSLSTNGKLIKRFFLLQKINDQNSKNQIDWINFGDYCGKWKKDEGQ